ncbi:hypothetical protein HDU86_007773 [Geranomyces michiganensis]|nr:hypothetical protein HDU86_007773 [Geranomyces michiganensis]
MFTKRAFAIRLTFPDDVSAYLIPSRLDWSLDFSELSGRTTANVSLIDDSPADAVLQQSLDPWDAFDVVYLRINRELLGRMLSNPAWATVVESYNLQGFTREALLGAAMRALFKASPQMERKLELVRSSVAEYPRLVKIGIQFRAGGGTGQAGFENDNANRTPLEMAYCFTARAVQFALDRRLTTDDAIFFVTSDFDHLQDVISESLNDLGYKTFFTTGPLTHIDKTPQEDLNGVREMKHWRTYLDWLIETEMDYLVISRSGFGETASFYTLNPTVRIQRVGNACAFETSNDQTSWPRTSIYNEPSFTGKEI